jgi:ABC-2 type transport system permease protein
MLVGVALAVFLYDRDPVSVGYVDRAGIVADAPAVVTTPSGENVGPNEDVVRFQGFVNLADGLAAVRRGDIDTLFVLPADYLRSGRVQAYSWDEEPSVRSQEGFKLLVQANLAREQTAEVQARLLKGPATPTLRSLDGRTPGGDYGLGTLLAPGVLAIFFSFTLMATTGYLLQAVTEEKENRMVEIMATSVSPNQLIPGKAAGLIAASLTQVTAWIAGAAGALVLALQFFDLPGELEISERFLVTAALFFVPSFILAASLIILIGAAVADFQQGQQVSGVLSMIFLLPMFFVALLFQDPDSPILVFLTLFPPSSFATTAFRWGLTVIPFWQLAASWALLAGATAASVVFAPRVFRLGMLGYGKRMSLRHVLTAARSPEV